MIRTNPTLNGSALAVSALIIAAAALAYNAGRNSCPTPAPVQTTITRAAS